MSVERLKKIEAFLPSEGEIILNEGAIEVRRSVRGIKSNAPFAGEYVLLKIEHVGSEFVKDTHEIVFQAQNREVKRVVINDERIDHVSGFGEGEYSEFEKELYAGTLLNSFSQCEEFVE